MLDRARFTSVEGVGALELHFGGTPAEDRRYHQRTFADELSWATPPGGPTPLYATSLGGRDVTGYEALSLRVAQRVDVPSNTTDLDLSVQIVDAAGREATVTAAAFADVTPPVVRAPGFGLWSGWSKAHFVTVRIPLAAFETDGRTVDLTRVEAVRLYFDRRGAGTAAIDDIAFVSD